MMIGLQCTDSLARRVIGEALAQDGWQVGDPGAVGAGGLILSDETADESWANAGLQVVRLGQVAKIRIGDLLLQLRRVADRSAHAASGEVDIGKFKLDAAHLTLSDARTGATVILTERERDILLWLHRAKGNPVDRRTLLAEIWSYAEGVETHTLETHIYRLRQKLEDDPAQPSTLLTDGSGYRLSFDS